jgi:hypothetical protein
MAATPNILNRKELGAAFGRNPEGFGHWALVCNFTVILSPGFSRAKDLSEREPCAKGYGFERSFVGLTPSSG